MLNLKLLTASAAKTSQLKVSSAALSIIKSLQGNTSYSMQVEYNTKIVMKDKTSGKVFKASSCNKLPIVVILEKTKCGANVYVKIC